jgi:hypothetical protein
VPPSNGIPLDDANGVLDMAWGALGILARACRRGATVDVRVHGVESDFWFSLFFFLFCYPDVVGLAPESYALR